jgi:hypothetical protein
MIHTNQAMLFQNAIVWKPTVDLIHRLVYTCLEDYVRTSRCIRRITKAHVHLPTTRLEKR